MHYIYVNMLMYVISLLFKYNAPTPQARQVETWSEKPSLHTNSQTSIFADIPPPTKRDSVFADRESQYDSFLPPSNMSLYEQDSSLSGVRSSSLSRIGAPIVTTVSHFNHLHVFLYLFT